jgi:hypothetical protein
MADAQNGVKRSRVVALLVAPAGVVVALVMLALRLHFQPLTVPEYAVVEAPSATAPVAVLHPGSHFDLEATPEHEVQGAVTARAFLVPAANAAATPQPWNVPLEIGRDGSVHVSGPVDTLFAGVPAGEWEVVLAIGRPELLPHDTRSWPLSGAHDAGQAAWRVVRRRVSLQR